MSSITENLISERDLYDFDDSPIATEKPAAKPLISAETRVIFEAVNLATIACLTCLFGMITNVINIVIFFKQGLNTTMNISLFWLAVSDFFSLLTLEWTTICMNPLFANSGVPWVTTEVQYLSGAWPHLCFGHITCWITTYITAERCLCIVLPLKVKQILTPKRAALIMFFLYIINFVSFIPEYSSVYLDWRYFPENNRTLVALAFRENRKGIEGLSFFMLAITGTACFPAVIIFTLILVHKLREQARWRSKTTWDTKQTAMTSKRDIKTMSMVVLIAGILILCYTPGIVTSVAAFFIPGFSMSGNYVNIFFVSWSFVACFESFNSSVNIFLYYKMSSKYKKTFHDLFGYRDKSGSNLGGGAEPTNEVD